MNKRKAKRITIKNPFSKSIVYIDTDDSIIIWKFKEQLKKAFPWWKLWNRTIFVPKGTVEVVRI